MITVSWFVCVLSVSANEKPSNLPLFASNPLASLATTQQGMAQKVIVISPCAVLS